MAELPDQHRLIEDFVPSDYLPTTQNNIRRALTQLAEWAAGRNVAHVAQLTEGQLGLYARYLRSEGYSVRTLAQKQGTIRRFFDSLVAQGILDRSPIQDGWVPTQPTRASREPTLTMDQIESMLPHARDDDGRALISLGGLDGIRLASILQLTAADVSFRKGRAEVTYLRNDGQPHQLDVCPQSAAILRDLIDARPSGPLVLPTHTAVNKRAAAARRVSLAARRARLPIRVTSRTLEKSRRADLLASGAPLHSVRKRLGLAFSNSKYAESLLPPGPGRRALRQAAQAAHEMDALELLRQAETLCDQPGITPIAPIVITGAALEMELRRLCTQRGLSVRKESIDAYSAVLYKAKVISLFWHSSNQTYGKLRNAAAHGTKSPDMTIEAARVMIQGVALFVGDSADDSID